jgi:hypothetical protein
MSKHIRLLKTRAALAVVVLGFACGDPTGPLDLVATMRVHPDTVVPGDTFHVSVTIRNPTADTVTLWSSIGCMVLTVIVRGGEVQDFGGRDLVCTLVITPFSVALGDSLFTDFEVVAFLAENQAPYQHVIPPPPGEYTVRALMLTELPDMEAMLVVMPLAQHAKVPRGVADRSSSTTEAGAT